MSIPYRLSGSRAAAILGYSTIQNSFTQVEGFNGYNDKHLKNDSKVIEAIKE